jgi:hypothetical protein
VKGEGVALKKKSVRLVIILLFFVIYFFMAVRSVPRETILVPAWISSLEADAPAFEGSSGQLLPFALGSHFGYVDSSGKFAVNRIKTSDIYLDEKMWTEYGNMPSNIEIKNIFQETIINIENTRGYPFLLDNRVFIFGSEQNELSEIDSNGNTLWTYDYGSPLTCIDTAAGLVLTGSLDGVIEILDAKGNRIYFFEPGGSRYPVILGCAVSRNGSQVGIISGVDEQRFIYLERFGNNPGEYKVIYHEYIGTGFRRPVHITFIDEDSQIVFEREGGIGCYSIKSRRTISIPFEGRIAAIDNSGDQGLLFLIISHSMQRNELIGIKIPQDNFFLRSVDMRNAIFLRAPFRSSDVFLGRKDSMFVAGGGNILISFNLEEK